jgi:hypothetical protein
VFWAGAGRMLGWPGYRYGGASGHGSGFGKRPGLKNGAPNAQNGQIKFGMAR